jgi:hypothetical protein
MTSVRGLKQGILVAKIAYVIVEMAILSFPNFAADDVFLVTLHCSVNATLTLLTVG